MSVSDQMKSNKYLVKAVGNGKEIHKGIGSKLRHVIDTTKRKNCDRSNRMPSVGSVIA